MLVGRMSGKDTGKRGIGNREFVVRVHESEAVKVKKL